MYLETCEADLPETKEMLVLREKCLPESLRASFIAEVTLEEGYVVQRGKPLRGRVTVHATNGSTQMSDISLAFYDADRPSWAIEHAKTNGDPDFYKYLCPYSTISGIISADSSYYLFDEENPRHRVSNIRSARGSLMAAKPFLDFELPIPTTAVPSSSSYYRTTMGALYLDLAVVYPRHVADCIQGVGKAKNANDDVDIMLQTEDRLWDSYTAVGALISSEPEPEPERLWERTLHFQATMALDVLGDLSEQQMDHYLTPGQPSPILLTSPPPDDMAFSFMRPVITEEPVANTSARLMRSKGTFDPYQYERYFDDYDYEWPEPAPDPAAHYNRGSYVGLLWKKKVVAEEKGIVPKTSTRQDQINDGESQRVFYVAP
ncbi:hypothetical protein K438DRAFT_1858946 [Mycena galopus ATCC 62051]|nr:hypothetical protein K438DRAFT_1858946 [Mycena galopus ATCC 62051]